jgi:nicotinamidase-related amidase
MTKDRNITTLIFTGIATEIGVESSARDAANRGFYPVIAEDCVSSADKDAHNRSLENMKKMFICENPKTIADNV